MHRRSRFRSWLAVVPAVGVALLPNMVCPACWPAYMGLLSSFGLGFMVKTTYLFPLTVIFLFVALGALAFRGRTRRRYGPFLLGLLAAMLVIVGKFVLSSDAAWYSGIIFLVGASLWNSWPRGIHQIVSCPACRAPETVYQLEAKQGD